MITNCKNEILEQVKSVALLDDAIIRISIANLISDISGEVYGIINKKGLARGQRKLSAIGGAAELYDKSDFEDMGAHDFEKSDCRFKIPFARAKEILEMSAGKTPDFMEYGPEREVKEELGEEILPGFIDEPILTEEDFTSLNSNFAGVMYNFGFGVSETRSLISLYIWRYFTLNGNKEVLKKIKKSKAIHKVSIRDCEDRRTQKGIYVGPNMVAAGKLIYE